jgi:acetyl esterase/lipase
VSGEEAPLVRARRGVRERALLACASAGLRASLVFTPRPAVLVLRRVFASGGARTARALAAHTPGGVTAMLDERYGEGRDELLDLYRPEGASELLPLVLWVHGGGWIGGSKEELSGWFRIVASHGYAVAGLRYSLAPRRTYPTPLRQAMQALRHLRERAPSNGIDATRIVIAGDSAGAQISAQLGALVTTPGYADAVGVAPALAVGELRGLVLACGPYDLRRLYERASTPFAQRMVGAVLWVYSGRRGFHDLDAFATASVCNHVTAGFPPVLVTVGNADPLRGHSELLVERLSAAGARVETLFFSRDHDPPLGHEYQFNLDSDAGRTFLERMLAFLERTLQGPVRSTRTSGLIQDDGGADASARPST